MNHTVEPTGEPLRFRVASTSNPGTHHLVDLSFNHGSGFCDCEAFAFQCEKNIKKGKALYSRGEPTIGRGGKISWPEATICRHIQLVHQYLLENLLKRVSGNGIGR